MADVDIGGLRALIEGASETDFAETNLSLRRDGDDSQMTTPGGSTTTTVEKEVKKTGDHKD